MQTADPELLQTMLSELQSKKDAIEELRVSGQNEIIAKYVTHISQLIQAINYLNVELSLFHLLEDHIERKKVTDEFMKEWKNTLTTVRAQKF